MIVTLYDDVYSCKIIVYVGLYDDYQQYLKKYLYNRDRIFKPTEYTGEYGEYWAPGHSDTKDGYRRTRFIWIEDFKKCPASISNLVHEVEHHVNGLMLEKGIPLSNDTDEAYAYYLESILKRILDKLWN